MNSGARSEPADWVSHRKLGVVECDAQSPLPDAPTVGVLEQGVSRDGDK
jgi:hypothetical protein